MTAYRRLQHGQLGFSLNEALVSLTLLSSGLFTLAQFQGRIQEQSAATKAQSTAVSLARQKLEELRSQAVSDYAGLAGGSDTPAANPGDTSPFRRRWTVTPHTGPDYKEVDVTTNWHDIDGSSQTATIRSFVTANAPYLGHGWSAQDAEASDTPSEEPAAEPTATATPETQGRDGIPPDSAETTAPANTATCLCRTDVSGARLDPRNSNADCSSDCCQDSANQTAGGICQGDSCTFVARCGVSS